MKNAEKQLSYAHSLETPDHKIVYIPEGSDVAIWGSNIQGRLALGYYMAYKTTKNDMYLRWAEDALEAFLEMPRSEVQLGDRTFFLFRYTPDSSAQVDPNQQATIGLTMTLFYHEPKSRYYLDANMRAVALENLDSSISLMTPDGRLPLAQEEFYIHQFDTRYGSFTLFKLSWANQFWKELRYEEALRRSVPWLDEITRAGISLRYYPEFYSGPPPDPAELWWRLPVMYYFGGDMVALQIELDKSFEQWLNFADIPDHWSTPFVVFKEMGIPHEVYLGLQ